MDKIEIWNVIDSTSREIYGFLANHSSLVYGYIRMAPGFGERAERCSSYALPFHLDYDAFHRDPETIGITFYPEDEECKRWRWSTIQFPDQPNALAFLKDKISDIPERRRDVIARWDKTVIRDTLRHGGLDKEFTPEEVSYMWSLISGRR